jgi:serine/threonine protein kinase
VRIGPFHIEPEPIAIGGQARIYRAYDPGSTEFVAVKAVTPTNNVVVHAGKTRRLRREVDALVRLEHPNAPRVLAADPNSEWYAMPLADGDLGHLLARGRVPWQALRAGMLAVADVVARAHELELVHRDLHDANVLVYPDRWCVADWGFVYNPRVERQTRQMSVFGREFYVAPEIYRDPQVVKPAADIFAIGRLAERGAALDSDRDSDGPAAAWWRTLIDGAGAYEERQRWTMADVLAHLRSPLPMSRPVGLALPSGYTSDNCPNCGSPQGFDAACRCLQCHSVAY